MNADVSGDINTDQNKQEFLLIMFWLFRENAAEWDKT